MSVLDHLRHNVHRALTSERGDAILPLRVSKDLGRRLNATLGKPIASRDELAARRTARAELARLRLTAVAKKAVKEAAPVFVYFMKNKNVDALTKIEALLQGQNVRFEKRDVAGDEAALSFVTREARCEEDDLPIVFVATRAVGGADRVTEAVGSGALLRLVAGDT